MTPFLQNLTVLAAAGAGTWLVVKAFNLAALGCSAIAKRSPRVKATSPDRSWPNDRTAGGEKSVASGATSYPVDFCWNFPERTM